MSSQHSQQRVSVYVDVQNLYYSAKSIYHAKVNFATILKAVVGRRQLVRAIAYVIKADIEEQDKFFNALREIGYEVRSKDLQVFYGGAKKGDWDVGIAMDMIEQAPKMDVMVLVSGDGDFVPVLQHLRRAVGCRVEVAAFGKSTSKRLVDEADSFTDLDERRFLIHDSRRRIPAASRAEEGKGGSGREGSA